MQIGYPQEVSASRFLSHTPHWTVVGSADVREILESYVEIEPRGFFRVLFWMNISPNMANGSLKEHFHEQHT
jgi:hypothetical protein